MTLSIVLPAYRMAHVLEVELPRLLQWLGRTGWRWEVIVVDDGSDDQGATEHVVTTCGCRYVRMERNAGKGAAVRAGMLAATGAYRIFTDADVPFELDALERFLFYLRDKEFDVAIGDRRLPDSSYFSEIEGARKIGSQIFTFIVGRFITTGFSDTQCGLKGFSAAAAEDLFRVTRLEGFAFDVEVLYVALKRNYDIKRLPVRFRGGQPESSVSLMRHAPGMLVDLFRIKLNHIRGRYGRQATVPR